MSVDQIGPVKTRTLSDEVTDRLREAVRSGALPPGTRLVEQEMAERLGVSRVPVREAIQALVDEGLVRKSPHRGAYVYLPSRKEIDEISSLRVVLECFVVERAIQNWSESHEAELRRIIDVMHGAMLAGDYQRIYEQDYAFHRKLWDIADHSILLEIVSSLRARISRFVFEATSALSPDLADHHVVTHMDLIDTLAGGDVAAAKEEITRHVLGAKERILTYCRLADSDPEPPGDGDAPVNGTSG